MLFYFRPGAGSVNPAICQSFIPAEIAHCEREPDLRGHLDHIRWGAAGVPRAFNALNCPERWHSHLDGVAWSHRAELLQEIPHCGSKLRSISRAHGSHSGLAITRFYASSHAFKLR